MTLHRVTTTAVRRAAAAAPLRAVQRRSVFGTVRDDMGGPGGQEPPPQKPSGFDKLKRNPIPIAGGLLALIAGISFMSSKSEKARQKQSGKPAATKMDNLPSASGLAKQMEDKESGALAELSGRKRGGGHGAFRSE